HLLAEREKLARVIEFAPDGMLIVDSTGKIVLANPAAVRMRGAQDQAGLLGQPMTALLPPEQRAVCQAYLNRVLGGSAAHAQVESILVCLTGMRMPIEMHIG